MSRGRRSLRAARILTRVRSNARLHPIAGGACHIRPSDRLRIRRITSTEVPSAATLFDEYRQSYGYPSDRTAALDYVRGCVAGGEVPVFTACLESRLLEPLGFTILYPTFSSIQMRRAWQMQDIYVVPRARRRGIARELMVNAIKFARQQGSDVITLLARVENEPATSLFVSLGFMPYEYEPEFPRYRLALH